MESKSAWILVFLLGVLCFNWPFLDVFRNHLPIYLFSAWAGLILILAVLAIKSAKKRRTGPAPGTGP